MRYAIYFTPPAGDPLTKRAASWLGRNVFTDTLGEHAAIGMMSAADVAHYTAAPRRYGFHATLKAPFALAEGHSEQELLRALMYFCSHVDPLTLPNIRLEQIGPFFALTPAAGLVPPALLVLASSVVREFEPFRAPLTESEIERRNPERLSRCEVANLMRWGYPYVMESFRFHMTLTGPVERSDTERVRQTLSMVFASMLDQPLVIGQLALFVEPEPGAPFVVHSLHPLGQVARRKSA